MELSHTGPLLFAAGGLLLGILLCWLALRAKQRAMTETAVVKAQAGVQAEATAAITRASNAESLLQAKRGELDRALEELRICRSELDRTRDGLAKAAERASRVPDLEASVAQLAETIRALDGQVVRLTGDAESHRARADLLAENVISLDHELTAARQASAASAQGFAEAREAAGKELAEVREGAGKALERAQSFERALAQTRSELEAERVTRRSAEQLVADLRASIASFEEQLRGERSATADKLALLAHAREELTNQFKALAAQALEANSQQFARANQDSLGQILDPLRQKLSEFQAKVEHVYDQENKDRSALQTEVRQMLQMNQLLAEQAKDLTSALRGSAKTQGNWGEVILDRVLEVSGLRKGIDYIVQGHETDPDGRRHVPDVVIHLPEDRRLIVDSKVSLVAYERFANADENADRAAALRAHLDSVRTHMRQLSERRYERLHGGSFDFVLMFVAVEPAFLAAVNHDQQFFADAWERNVLLVSPSTLLFVLRSVAHLWRQEQQSRNAQEIASRGGELYDKLVAFANELEQVGENLGRVQRSYDEARKRLSTGRGNAIRQAEMLKELGVKPTKALPRALTDLAAADAESRGETIPLIANGTVEAITEGQP